jgi:outer membrane lipoprotein SlyB
MKKLASIVVGASLLISGCATNQGPEYSGKDYNQIKHYEIGTVVGVRPVVVTDSGTGTFLGALIGTVLGSTVGRGSGTTLAMLGGGLAGSYAGSEIAKANASELTVELDSGDNIVVVVKGKHIVTGDRVKIIKDGNRASEVSKID